MDLKDNEILTVPCRLAFASLFKATPKHPTTPTEVRYQATVLIPKGSDMSPYANAIKAAMVEKFGKPIKLEGRCMPLKESGGQTTQDGRPYVGFEKGGYHFKAMNKYVPQIVDQAKQAVLKALPAGSSQQEVDQAIADAERRVYSGCWCRFFVRAYGWDNASGKGVSFSLEAVQLFKDDTAFAGRKDANDLFDAVDMGDDAPLPDGVDAAPDDGTDDPLARLLG